MRKKFKLPKIPKLPALLPTILAAIAVFFVLTTAYYIGNNTFLKSKLIQTQKQEIDAKKALEDFKNIDQVVRNDELEKLIKELEETYDLSVKSYEELIKLEEVSNDTAEQKQLYISVLTYLSERNYASATATLTQLNDKIKEERSKAVAANAPSIPANVSTNNAAPGSGYSRQYVKNEYGTYLVDIIATDLNSSRVVVDTASDGTCGNDCPVTSLADYAGRSGAFAGINGPYFCPADYPSCDGKKNSFDTLLMNKNKVYFNSDNNVYSTVPAIIFTGNSARVVGQSLEWGRDTGVDSVIASQPLLLAGGNVTFGGDDEIKRSGKGSRSFIGSNGNIAYIGVVHNANVAEVAQVLKTLGLQNALNLDSGGSTALWNGGSYIVGPGRNTPFGILFVHK